MEDKDEFKENKELQELQELLSFDVISQEILEDEAKKEIESNIEKNKSKKRKNKESGKNEQLEDNSTDKVKFHKLFQSDEDVKLKASVDSSNVKEVDLEPSPEYIPIEVKPESLPKKDQGLEESEYFSESEYETEGNETDVSEYLPEDYSSPIKAKKRINKEMEEEDIRLNEDFNEEDEFLSDKELKYKDDYDTHDFQTRIGYWEKARASYRTEKTEIKEQNLPHPLYPDKILKGGLKIPGEIYKDLMEYQKKGIEWLWGLFQNEQGGVLADEMGLGKTIQTIAFLSSLYYTKKITQPTLIIAPATLTSQWIQEFHRWWPPLRIINLSQLKPKKLKVDQAKGNKIHSILPAIKPCFRKGTVFVASYEGAMSYGQAFSKLPWGCLFLDEGHKISNPDTKTSKGCKLFNTHYRYILSGTPIQNKLKELWSIYDFVRPGLLGTLEEFDRRVARSIELTSTKGNDVFDKQIAIETARNLRSVIKTNILRRVKADVINDIPNKKEQVIYCKLHLKQFKAYVRYLNSPECASVLSNKRNHMLGITTLRKISNHPDLLEYKSRRSVEHYGHYRKSGKTRVLDGLLKLWKKEGHRVLIFCQTVQMQEILEKMEFFENEQFLSMNGKTPVAKRLRLVDQFNINKDIFAFILTTRTGGQGLNLTGANRVVIFDPDWNPSADLQALSRAWRIGQTKEVFIYRLLASGTIEERVHHLQMYKQILSDRILKDPKQKLLFRNHTNDLFAYPSLNNVLKKNMQKNEKGTETAEVELEEAKNMLKDAENYNPHYSIEESIKQETKENEQDQFLNLIGVVGSSNTHDNPLESITIDPLISKMIDRNIAELQKTGEIAKKLQAFQAPNGIQYDLGINKDQIGHNHKPRPKPTEVNMKSNSLSALPSTMFLNKGKKIKLNEALEKVSNIRLPTKSTEGVLQPPLFPLGGLRPKTSMQIRPNMNPITKEGVLKPPLLPLGQPRDIQQSNRALHQKNISQIKATGSSGTLFPPLLNRESRPFGSVLNKGQQNRPSLSSINSKINNTNKIIDLKQTRINFPRLNSGSVSTLINNKPENISILKKEPNIVNLDRELFKSGRVPASSYFVKPSTIAPNTKIFTDASNQLNKEQVNSPSNSTTKLKLSSNASDSKLDSLEKKNIEEDDSDDGF